VDSGKERLLTDLAKRIPIIGVTIDISEDPAKYESPCAYAYAVEKAGGLPILLPYRADLALIPRYVDLIDGILFTGGDDLDPTTFGETRHAKAIPVDPMREKFEMALLAEVEKRRIPILGICMGSQLMNVYRGGSLIQFLPDEQRTEPLEHRKVGDFLPRHAVELDTSSKLGEAIGKNEISVNSYHKQAVRKIGRGLKIIATAPDGVIEGFEDPDMPLFAAVQWHPERLYDKEPEHLAPFKLLVEAAARGATNSAAGDRPEDRRNADRRA
jgi:putative glutamine amidotransferase